MSQPPSAKRKRVEFDSADTPDSAPIRSKIWMTYGDIILQAESTQFRVNRDVLARKSPVFRDMFDVPQPPNEPTVEGCPIVHVFDTAQDWELLLEVFYDSFKATHSRPFDVVASMLRLGKKYEMSAPKEDALQRIRTEFPTSLAQYVSNEYSGNFTVITAEDNLTVQLLRLAYECGVYSAIPAMGLGCLTTNTLTQIRAEGILGNETLVILAIAAEGITAFETRSLSWLHGTNVIPHKSCKFPNDCKAKQMHITFTMARRSLLHPGCTMSEWKDGPWFGQFCGLCDQAAREAYETNRQKTWKLLPTFFGLPAWEDIKDTV
ncbi:hypothetical protein C8R46DRAFT_937541 [Mycena filopes]|nr:hypothetical protein C8R46DRAFT_937541 [Mycena filopes]